MSLIKIKTKIDVQCVLQGAPGDTYIYRMKSVIIKSYQRFAIGKKRAYRKNKTLIFLPATVKQDGYRFLKNWCTLHKM